MDTTNEIQAWQIGRTDCLAREAAHGLSSRWAEEIQSYDDQAVAILEQVAPLIEAVEQLMEHHLDMWFDNSASFSCSEIDSIAQLIEVTHDTDTAHSLLVDHAQDDECGDAHWHLNPASLDEDADND